MATSFNLKVWCYSLAWVSVFSACTSEYLSSDEPRSKDKSIVFNSQQLFINTPYVSETIGGDLVQAFTEGYALGKGTEMRALIGGDKAVGTWQPVLSEKGDTLLYVINYRPTGYVLLSAHRDCTPILVQSEDGYFDTSKDNPMMKYLLDECKAYVLGHHFLPDSIKRQNRFAWDLLGLNKKPVNLERLRSSGETEGINEVVNLYMSTLSNAQLEGYKVYTLDDYQLTSILQQNSLYTIENLKEKEEMYACKRYGKTLQSLLLVKENPNVTYYEAALLKTTWGQGNGYNQFVPQYNPQKPNQYPIGCMATALGQIMYHHKYPKNYDWQDMKLNSPTESSARLLYDIALGVKMDFGVSGSSATISPTLSYLKKVGYSSARHIQYSEEEIKRNLREGLPVLVGGSIPKKDQAGHAYVLDGYRYVGANPEIKLLVLEDTPSGYIPQTYQNVLTIPLPLTIKSAYHFNAGWNGVSDGYYYGGIFQGSNQFGSFDYSDDRQCIVDIKPNKN